MGMTLKEIAENHGLTPEGVDYALTQYQIVICEITHGMLSKLSYDANDIIRTAQERWCDTCELKEQEPLPVPERKLNECTCGHEINRYWHPKFCGFCGKELMWY